MNYIEMTEEKFAELIKQDKWINNIQYACKCCDKDGKFKYYRTVSYPTSYIVTEGQIAKAQELASIRKNEILDSIKRSDLVFKAMGGSYNGKYTDGVNNHRIRCNFKASNGKKYFVELAKEYIPQGYTASPSRTKRYEAGSFSMYWDLWSNNDDKHDLDIVLSGGRMDTTEHRLWIPNDDDGKKFSSNEEMAEYLINNYNL